MCGQGDISGRITPIEGKKPIGGARGRKWLVESGEWRVESGEEDGIWDSGFGKLGGRLINGLENNGGVPVKGVFCGAA